MNGSENGGIAGKNAARIEVSADGLYAFLLLPRPFVPGSVTPDSVREMLEAAGVEYGLSEDLIDSLGGREPADFKLTVAEGTAPVNGADGSIEYCFDTGAPAKVSKGDRIADIKPPGPAIDGISVTGGKISALAGKTAVLPELKNVEISGDGGSLSALTGGYFIIDSFTARVRPFFELSTDAAGTSAEIIVAKRVDDGDFGPEDIAALLKEKGVVSGVLDTAIEDIFRESRYEIPVTVARGKEVVHGKDGEILYNFDADIGPEADGQGNVNFKELNLIKNVKAGEKIAEILSPTPGEEGMTIFGAVIQPKEGVKPVLPAGKNTEPDSENPDILLAAIDGSVRLNGAKIEIDPVFNVKKHVDYSTGNIRFVGSVVINGDVKSGFKVRAKGDVQVNGTVEDASIESGGSVAVRYGFIGRGGGRITADGDVHVAFCDNQTIVSGGDVVIGTYAMNSDIESQGTITATAKKGMLSGGEYTAVKGIELNIAGGVHGESTSLIAGVDKVVRIRLETVNAQIGHIEELLKKQMRRRLVKKDIPPRIQVLLDQLNEAKERYEIQKTTILAEIDTLPDKEDIFKAAAVTVHDTVFPVTDIRVFNQFMSVTDTVHATRFRLTGDGVLVMDSLKDAGKDEGT